jgi:hypothetical protein
MENFKRRLAEYTETMEHRSGSRGAALKCLACEHEFVSMTFDQIAAQLGAEGDLRHFKLQTLNRRPHLLW